MKHRIWFAAILGFGFAVSCATPVKLAGKAATFALKAGVGVAWNVAKGIGKIGTKEAVHALDLTADAATQILAEEASGKLVGDFWNAVQNGAIDAAYRMFSDGLKRDLKKRAFASYVAPWAGHIAAFEIIAQTVRQFSVEVPTRLTVHDPSTPAPVGVTVYVSNVDGRWQITGWEADPPRTDAR